MTEIQVPDEPAREPEPSTTSPYRDLLIPLIVVPAVIVMALVLVFVLFGAIAGEEATPQENVAKVMSGGANESRQAAFNLMRQVLEDLEAEKAGREGEWGIGPDLIPALRDALDDRLPVEDEDEAAIPLALAATLVNLGDEAAVMNLAEFLTFGDEIDPEGQYRWQTAYVLGSLGDRIEGGQQSLIVERLAGLLSSRDEGLRTIAAIALQTYPTTEALLALEGALADASLQVRGSAAIALAEQGDARGAEVLLSLIDEGVYEEERAQIPEKWTRAADVSVSRQRALVALKALGRLPGATELERLADDDPDGRVRELARAYLADAK